jgi:hypothetical protein
VAAFQHTRVNAWRWHSLLTAAEAAAGGGGSTVCAVLAALADLWRHLVGDAAQGQGQTQTHAMAQALPALLLIAQQALSVRLATTAATAGCGEEAEVEAQLGRLVSALAAGFPYRAPGGDSAQAAEAGARYTALNLRVCELLLLSAGQSGAGSERQAEALLYLHGRLSLLAADCSSGGGGNSCNSEGSGGDTGALFRCLAVLFEGAGGGSEGEGERGVCGRRRCWACCATARWLSARGWARGRRRTAACQSATRAGWRRWRRRRARCVCPPRAPARVWVR